MNLTSSSLARLSTLTILLHTAIELLFIRYPSDASFRLDWIETFLTLLTSKITASGIPFPINWGLLFAVIVVRGLLPWIIVWIATPGVGPWEAFTAAFSNDPRVHAAIEASAPMLLAGGGTFLIFLFFHWLFLEPKNYGLRGERFFHSQGVWFFAVSSILL